MSKKLARMALAACASAFLAGCFTMRHTVGRGPQNTPHLIKNETQWFALWGVVPVGENVDSAELAGNTHDYRVTTKFTVIDVILSAFTSFVSFYRQTIIVEK